MICLSWKEAPRTINVTWRSFGTNPASTAARVAPTKINRKRSEYLQGHHEEENIMSYFAHKRVNKAIMKH